MAPAGYSPSDRAIVYAAQSEQALVIHSDAESHHWGPLIAAFRKLYPWIAVMVRFIKGDLDYVHRSELSVADPSADLIISSSDRVWASAALATETEPHLSPQLTPESIWSPPCGGIFAVSIEPIILIGNSGDLARGVTNLETADSSKFRHFSRSSGTGVMLRKSPGGPLVAPETTGSLMPLATIFDQLAFSQTEAKFLVASHQFFSRTAPAYKEKINWALTPGKTFAVVQKIGLMRAASNRNAARLMIDFILSHQGQVAMARGGSTPLRPDVKPAQVPNLTFNALAENVGAENIVILH